MKKFLITFLSSFILFHCYSQQSSDITIESGNGNEFEVRQEGKDTLQDSKLKIKNSANNRVRVIQANTDSLKRATETSRFMSYVNNTNLIITTCAAGIALLITIRKLVIKKNKVK